MEENIATNRIEEAEATMELQKSIDKIEEKFDLTIRDMLLILNKRTAHFIQCLED